MCNIGSEISDLRGEIGFYVRGKNGCGYVGFGKNTSAMYRRLREFFVGFTR